MGSTLKKLTFFVALLVGGGYVYLTLRGPQGIPALLEKRRQVRQLQEENLALREENQRQRAWNKELRDNPDVVAPIIRKRYNLTRPGETDFKLPPSKPAPEQAR